jgi:hypothetical protein
MLKVTPRGKLEGLRGQSEQEDRALRDAFSHWPARSLSAAVVGAYQRLGAVTGFCATARARARLPLSCQLANPLRDARCVSMTVTH